MKVTISRCRCPKCGEKFPIPRRDNRKRPRGHIKTIYCPFCRKETDMIEIRDEDFEV